MPTIKTYHRPTSVEEALRLLTRTGVSSAIIAGGTYATAHLGESIDEIIDLQAVGLDELAVAGNRLTVGAMVRLQTLVDDERVPPLLRELAHREGPNTVRHQATIGGIVIGAEADSELLAGLLVHETEVTVESTAGSKSLSLADFLADVPAALGGGLVITISVATSGLGAGERVARTPADRPIVAAVARLDATGQPHLALCGVAATPILVPADPDQLAQTLSPPADFRGSSDYRRQMAVTLSRRVLGELS
jgi:CO/xanthine dehydrogenase FAD-binding subunit